MDPSTALEMQLAAYRRMTPEQRLDIALSLHELACDLAREGIRFQNPGASEEEVERQLRRRIELGRDLQEITKGREREFETER